MMVMMDMGMTKKESPCIRANHTPLQKGMDMPIRRPCAQCRETSPWASFHRHSTQPNMGLGQSSVLPTHTYTRTHTYPSALGASDRLNDPGWPFRVHSPRQIECFGAWTRSQYPSVAMLTGTWHRCRAPGCSIGIAPVRRS